MAGLEWLEPTCWQAQQARLKDAKRPKGQKANETFRDVLWRFYEIMRAGRIAMSIAPDPFVPPCVAELELRRPTRNSDEQGQPLDSAMIQYALILDDPSATSWPRDRLDSDFQISSLTYLTLLRRSLQHLWALERKHVEGYLLQRLNCPQTAVFWMCGSTQCLRSNICMQGATVSRPCSSKPVSLSFDHSIPNFKCIRRSLGLMPKFLVEMMETQNQSVFICFHLLSQFPALHSLHTLICPWYGRWASSSTFGGLSESRFFRVYVFRSIHFDRFPSLSMWPFQNSNFRCQKKNRKSLGTSASPGNG